MTESLISNVMKPCRLRFQDHSGPVPPRGDAAGADDEERDDMRTCLPFDARTWALNTMLGTRLEALIASSISFAIVGLPLWWLSNE
jgi:hypothetical protein